MTQPTYTTSSQDMNSVASKPKRKTGTRFTSGHLLMVVSGLLAFLLSLVVLTSREATVTVFVAKSDIVAGKVISASQFDPKLIPSSDLDSQYVTKAKFESGDKFFSSRSINEGEPLTVGAITPDADKSDVRLISIPIDKSLAVAGALSRGDRIDILYIPEGGCAERVLRNLEVTSTPSGSSGGGLGGGSNAYTITVSIEKAGQDLTLAGIIAAGTYQVVKTTGATESNPILTDQYCENGLDVDDNGSEPIGG